MLDRKTVEKTLRGYARAHRIVESEHRAWLERLTLKQGWALFED